jgi:hypothetical protein
MANDAIRSRYDAFFSQDFMPLIRHDQTQGAEERMAYAAEFTAFQLGQINKKLGRLVDLMEGRPQSEGATSVVASPALTPAGSQ